LLTTKFHFEADMTAFRATFSDMKLVKTRQVAQLIFEIPIEEFDAAYEVLGGMPVPSKERWFGIAALVAGATAPVAGRSMAREQRAEQGNPGGRHALAPDDFNPDTEEASRDEPAPVKPRRDWRDLPASQQAGIRINEATFAAYLCEEHSDEWHETGDADECLKLICRIQSKTELMADPRRTMLWHQLDTAYQAWLAKERVGA
jgi:hypothetical protein